MLARENRGTFLAVYIARVRMTVQADGATIIREGHGTGEGRGTSPGEVHDIALKAAETDATKRALATFGKPFGLALYRNGKTARPRSTAMAAGPKAASLGFHPDDTTPSRGRPATMAAGKIRQCARRLLTGQPARHRSRRRTSIVPAAPDLLPGQDRQKRARHSRAQTAARQGSP